MSLLSDLFVRKDKAKPNFSNVKSGSSTTTTVQPPTAAPGVRTVTVVAGDSLSKIAKRAYGDSSKWKQIYEANRDLIKNPDLIHPGQILRIPL